VRGYPPLVTRLVLLLALGFVACSGPRRKKDACPTKSLTAQDADEPAQEKQSIWEDFIDDGDRALDISDFLDRDLGFLPIVVPITEPAVGFGLVGGLVFFHDKGAPKPGVPPTLTAVVGGGTTNDTVFAVGAGFRYMIARKRGIQAGIDVAYSDDEFAFYITVGSAWLR